MSLVSATPAMDLPTTRLGCALRLLLKVQTMGAAPAPSAPTVRVKPLRLTSPVHCRPAW